MLTLNAPIKPDIKDLDVYFYDKASKGEFENIINLFGEIFIYYFTINNQDIENFPDLIMYRGRKLYLIDDNNIVKLRISECESKV